MTTTHIITPEYLDHMKASPDALRVGIMAPVNEQGEVDLCPRWQKPFEKAGFEVVLLPVGTENPREVLALLDGFVLPGGHADIHPDFRNAHSYDMPRNEGELLDVKRDEYAMHLAHILYDTEKPSLLVCRGSQEFGVAFGETLELLKEDPVRHSAGYDHDGDHEAMDRVVHDVVIQPGGVLADVFGEASRMGVNSIHRFGFYKLSDMFHIEAICPDDGAIEAYSALDGTILAMQAHPEFDFGEGRNQWHKGIFNERFARMRAYHQQRTGDGNDLTVENAVA